MKDNPLIRTGQGSYTLDDDDGRCTSIEFDGCMFLLGLGMLVFAVWLVWACC